MKTGLIIQTIIIISLSLVLWYILIKELKSLYKSLKEELKKHFRDHTLQN